MRSLERVCLPFRCLQLVPLTSWMRRKPDSGLGFKPKDTLASSVLPGFRKRLYQSQAAAKAFREFYPSLSNQGTQSSSMARLRSTSFSDDDLEIVGSQAVASQTPDVAPASTQGRDLSQPIWSGTEVIEIPSDSMEPPAGEKHGKTHSLLYRKEKNIFNPNKAGRSFTDRLPSLGRLRRSTRTRERHHRTYIARCRPKAIFLANARDRMRICPSIRTRPRLRPI